jgi:hypothetical protein
VRLGRGNRLKLRKPRARRRIFNRAGIGSVDFPHENRAKKGDDRNAERRKTESKSHAD